MKTKQSFTNKLAHASHKLLALATVTVFSVTLISSGVAQANIILFQDDAFQDVMSDALRLGSNDAGASNTAIQFGNDGTGSENGNITWNITSNTFEFDHAIDVTGTVTADGITSTGTANFSGTSQFRIREIADFLDTGAACTTAGEVIVDLTTNRFYICTDAAEDTWEAATAEATLSFNEVYAQGNTLTTNDGAFNIAPGTGEFDVTSTGVIDFNSASFTLDTSGNIGLTSGGNITLTSTGSLAISTNAWDITAAGAASGFTTIGASGNITTSGGTLVVGTTALNATTAANNSGAFLVGTFDEFGNSNGTNVQDVLDDLDAVITTNASDIADNTTDIATNATNIGTNTTNISTNASAITSLQGVTGANAPNSEILSFYPQYPGSVLFADGSNNLGTMSLLYDDTNDEHYYEWTSSQGTTQDMDIKFRFSLPADFVSFDTNDAFQYRYRTGTTTEANNDVEIRVYNATDETTGNPSLCASDTTNVTDNEWTTASITASAINTGGECTSGDDTLLGAGDVVEIAIKLLDNSSGGTFANIGRLIVNYDN